MKRQEARIIVEEVRECPEPRYYTYTREFMLEAVRLSESRERIGAQIALDLDA